MKKLEMGIIRGLLSLQNDDGRASCIFSSVSLIKMDKEKVNQRESGLL